MLLLSHQMGFVSVSDVRVPENATFIAQCSFYICCSSYCDGYGNVKTPTFSHITNVACTMHPLPGKPPEEHAPDFDTVAPAGIQSLLTRNDYR